MLFNLGMRRKCGCRVKNPKLSATLFAVSAFCFGLAALAAVIGRYPVNGLTYGGLAVLYFCLSLKYRRLGRIKDLKGRPVHQQPAPKAVKDFP